MRVIMPSVGLIGPCPGVDRGLNLVMTAIEEAKRSDGTVVYEQAYTPPLAIEIAKDLESQGHPVMEWDGKAEIKNPIFFISPYGCPPREWSRLMLSTQGVYDATCSFVQRKYFDAAILQPKRQVVIIGFRDDYETQTLVKYARRAVVVEDDDDLRQINFGRDIKVIGQSTFPLDYYFRLVNRIKDRARGKVEMEANHYCPHCEHRLRVGIATSKTSGTLLLIGELDSGLLNYFSRQPIAMAHTKWLETIDDLPAEDEIKTWPEPICLFSSVSTAMTTIEKFKQVLEAI